MFVTRGRLYTDIFAAIPAVNQSFRLKDVLKAIFLFYVFSTFDFWGLSMRLIFHKHTFENQNVWSFLLFFSVTGFVLFSFIIFPM